MQSMGEKFDIVDEDSGVNIVSAFKTNKTKEKGNETGMEENGLWGNSKWRNVQ